MYNQFLKKYRNERFLSKPSIKMNMMVDDGVESDAVADDDGGIW